MQQKPQEPLLKIKNLRVAFELDNQSYLAVRGIDFSVYKGQSLGIIGESGCGKTQTALSILRLIPKPVGSMQADQIWFDGQRVDAWTDEQFRPLRGNQISMIFQEPMSAFNPIMTVGEQMFEVVRLHLPQELSNFKVIIQQLLVQVGLSDTERILKNYPHQLSGGQQQRVMIALALVAAPKLLLADEPTTALDLTIQAQILYLLQDLQQKHQMSVVFITHDLSVIAQCCDYVLVMYRGKIVEQASVEQLFKNPKHPYTVGLIQTLKGRSQELVRLPIIRGTVPTLQDTWQGCSFANRCDYASSICQQEPGPELQDFQTEHQFACHHPIENHDL